MNDPEMENVAIGVFLAVVIALVIGIPALYLYLAWTQT